MAHDNYIIVPSGLKPVHSFDMYGVLVNAWKLGEEQVRLFQKVAQRESIPQTLAEQVIADYRALNRGEQWAVGVLKGGIIDALKKPIERHPDLLPDYASALYPDGIEALQEIYAAGEQALIFSTRKQEWVTQYIVPLIGNVEIPLYEGNKTNPSVFREVGMEEHVKGRRIVTHTADELPEMAAAAESRLFSGVHGKLIFVNRNNTVPRENALAVGIDMYVEKLTDVGYAGLVER